MKDPFAAVDNQGTDEGSSQAVDNEILMRAPGEYGPNPEALEHDLVCLHLERVEEYNLRALDELTKATGMPITQENGQRRYGPPLDCEITIPPRGSEVFVGKLPRDCYEPELVPVFEQAGRIYELRLMMDFSGTNRGYCFVHYFEPEEADRAVRELNNFEIRPGRKIGVTKSVDNCRLFFGCIPKDKTAQEIHNEVDKIVDGLVDVIVHPSQSKNENNRGFAFVEFESHKAAAMARRKYKSGKIPMFGGDIAVDWAEPLDDDCQGPKAAKSPQKSNDSENIAHSPNKALPPRRRRDRTPRFRRAGHPNRLAAMKDSGTSAPPMGYVLSFQQQSVLQQGFLTNNGESMAGNYLNSTNVFQQYSHKGTTYSNNTFTNQVWCGIPGVPPSIYFGQWTKSDQTPLPQIQPTGMQGMGMSVGSQWNMM